MLKARSRALLTSSAVAITAVLALAGCTGGQDGPTPTYTPSGSGAPTASPAPTATSAPDPVYIEGGTAEQNHVYFDYVNNLLGNGTAQGNGRGIVDNLVAGGFTKADLEVTPDNTAIGLAVDAMVFSAKFGEECIVGQYSVSGGYSSTVSPVLSTGKCLVGETRPIDW